ncbi:MAG: hypothetical protein BWY99_02750 [Synergistetes bacterium ADurb.BinA166]|nr:MAG: hypothetical protein BWY99_02750 [Synergistetes bacterium ADurb.BinA166]
MWMSEARWAIPSLMMRLTSCMMTLSDSETPFSS